MRAEMEATRRRLGLLEKLERAAMARKEAVEARLAGMPQVPLIFFFVFFSCATRVWDGRQWRGWWRKAFKCEPESAKLPVPSSKCEPPSARLQV